MWNKKLYICCEVAIVCEASGPPSSMLCTEPQSHLPRRCCQSHIPWLVLRLSLSRGSVGFLSLRLLRRFHRFQVIDANKSASLLPTRMKSKRSRKDVKFLNAPMSVISWSKNYVCIVGLCLRSKDISVTSPDGRCKAQ